MVTTRGLVPTIISVSNEPTLEGNQKAQVYPFGHVALTMDDQKKPVFVHFLTTSSVLIDNYSRQVSGDKFYRGRFVLDYPRNPSGNSYDPEGEERRGRKPKSSK